MKKLNFLFTALISGFLFLTVSAQGQNDPVPPSDPTGYINNRYYVNDVTVYFDVTVLGNGTSSSLMLNLYELQYDGEVEISTWVAEKNLGSFGEYSFFSDSLTNLKPGTKYLLHANAAGITGPVLIGALRFETTGMSSVGIQDLKSSSFEMYPNPISDLLTIESDQPMGTVQVHSVNGQLIAKFPFSDDFQNQKLEISMKDFPEGNYIVTAEKLPIRKMISVIH